jgi:hypothetical protein
MLFTIIILTWGFCHRLTTHSYETVLRILTDIFMDQVNHKFEGKLKLYGGDFASTIPLIFILLQTIISITYPFSTCRKGPYCILNLPDTSYLR